MYDTMRDAPVGQLLRIFFKIPCLRYTEEQPGFDLRSLQSQAEKEIPDPESDNSTKSQTKDNNLIVSWYSQEDPENPQNWSQFKKAVVAFQISIYTFAVYMGSSIYVPATEDIMTVFNVNHTTSSLGLALYVLGYGIGPLLWSPLSEIPRLGRNIPYLTTFVIFIALVAPSAVVDNLAGFLVLRFLQGFFGSPCLATGGATMGDMYSIPYLPFSVAIWTAFAFCAPAIGPIVSGFSIPVEGWRWAMWEILWLCGPILVCWLFFLPETNPATILGQRAARLRELTGDNHFRTQAELDRKDLTANDVFVSAIIKPCEIMFKDPAVLFTNVYTALTYGIYYSFFECFPLVYPSKYGFNIGQTGLVFLSVIVGCFLGMMIYFAYVYWRLIPRIMSHPQGIFGLPPEWRLRPALPGVIIFTGSLIGFGWSVNPDVHWIVSCIMLGIYGGAVFIMLQCVFVYIPFSYPQYTASLFAGNDFGRSLFAFGAILFGRPLYINLGVGKGTTLLGGLSVMGIIGMWLLYAYGAKLRARSTFAVG